jgi:hypothetical protein
MAHSCGALVGAKVAFAAVEVQAAPMAIGGYVGIARVEYRFVDRTNECLPCMMA